MIRPLRRRHFMTFLTLLFLLPAAYLAGLAARNPPRPMNQIPADLSAQVQTPSVLVNEWPDLWGNLPMVTRLFSDEAATRMVVVLDPQHDLLQPDILLYWSGTAPSVGDTLQKDSYFMGSFSGRTIQRFVLPGVAVQTNGHLVLYSLARDEVIASAALPAGGRR